MRQVRHFVWPLVRSQHHASVAIRDHVWLALTMDAMRTAAEARAQETGSRRGRGHVNTTVNNCRRNAVALPGRETHSHAAGARTLARAAGGRVAAPAYPVVVVRAVVTFTIAFWLRVTCRQGPKASLAPGAPLSLAIGRCDIARQLSCGVPRALQQLEPR